MLLSVCEFRENRCSEDRTFLRRVNVITFTRVAQGTYDTLKIKNALVKSYGTKPRSTLLAVLLLVPRISLRLSLNCKLHNS